VRVSELLDESLNEAKDRIQLNQIQVEKKYGASSVWLHVDKAQMKIALLNIIVNAIEAMTPGQGVLQVESELTQDLCRIIIRDNGKGMDADMLSKVFDPYFTSKTKGNGLGLTNTQNIVLNHKGKIQAFSTPGKGTGFVISMTISRPENPASV
jgi:signal transduction histidine kinase